MSLVKDWPSKLQEFYYNDNNRVNKSTRPSTPYQLAPPTESGKYFFRYSLVYFLKKKINTNLILRK